MREWTSLSTFLPTQRRVVVLCACLWACSALAASSRGPHRVAPEPGSYSGLLQQYCDGQVAAVSSSLARWAERDFDEARNIARSVDPTRRVLAAFMHTEALETQWREEKGRIVLKHAEFARTLALGSQRFASGESARLARMWSVALGYLYLSHLALTEADRHLTHMRSVFPRDPDLLVAAGVVHELQTTPLGQRLPAQSRAISQHKVAPSNRHRLKAVSFYTQALAIDREHPEALLRLGRMHFVIGASDVAEAAFKRVGQRQSDLRSNYLAHLFLGLLYEQQDKLSAAAEQYERAIAVLPNTQTAPLALATLRGRTGSGMALSQISQRFDGSLSPVRSDPWSDYLFARSTRVREVAQLARRIARCR